ncbi:MAG: hypothetical protein AB7F89_27425, partial [Pirellulaceae bacterium]
MRQRITLVVVYLGLVSATWMPAADILTVAGTGSPASNGQTGQALQMNIGQPFGVEVGPGKSLYITEVLNHRVWRLDEATGTVTVVAGSGRKGHAGDGGPATQAELN